MLSRRLLLAAATIAALSLAGCNKGGGAGPGAGTASADDMSLGQPNAPVKMVEYASASCPHCARFANDVFPQFKAKYIDTGRVYYTFKEFLTPPENVAAAGFLTARCAGKDKYFTVLGDIFRDQEQMYQSGDFAGGLLRIAQSAGMSEDQFNRCINDAEALKALNARVERAIKDGVTSTPTFLMNGKKIAEGEVTMEQLDAAVAAAAK
jgi:protein-disulfide isomerase